MNVLLRKAALVLGLPLLVLSSNVSAGSSDALLEAQLSAAAPSLAPKVLKLALSAMQCATASGVEASNRLAVIDYSLSANVPRMWVFDLEKRKVLHKELVAHGRNSGDELATSFSNRVGSYQSSIGLFRTGATYDARNGYSLRI